MTLDKASLHTAAAELAARDPLMAEALRIGGPPKMWKRPATFATFIRIILEQQVSLASAWNTFDRLRALCPHGRITPAAITALGEPPLKAAGFSRQKTRYALQLAANCTAGRFKVRPLATMSDDAVREAIVSQLGMGNWTADIYLMMALSRGDIFPIGDLAIVNGYAELRAEKLVGESLLQHSLKWQPYRSVAARLIWGIICTAVEPKFRANG